MIDGWMIEGVVECVWDFYAKNVFKTKWYTGTDSSDLVHKDAC